MIWRCAVAVSLFLAVACGKDEPAGEDPLPVDPQLFPNPLTGLLAFPMTRANVTSSWTVTFTNGGQHDLVISDIHIERESTAGVLTLGQVTPSSRVVPSTTSLAAPITFAPTVRGIYLAHLVVASNAANLPNIDIELIGPATTDPPPVAPDIMAFESTVQVVNRVGIAFPVAFVRYYNLGETSLQVDSYALANTTNFRFLLGTEVPGDACSDTGVCVPSGTQTQGCCGNLTCNTSLCSAMQVGSGDFRVAGVRFTSTPPASNTSTTVTLSSNDPNAAQTVVTVEAP